MQKLLNSIGKLQKLQILFEEELRTQITLVGGMMMWKRLIVVEKNACNRMLKKCGWEKDTVAHVWKEQDSCKYNIVKENKEF